MHWPRSLNIPASLVALVVGLGMAGTGCGSSSSPGADFSAALTTVLAPGAKNEVLDVAFVKCIHDGLSASDRQAIVAADTGASGTDKVSNGVADDVTVRTIRRAAHCDRGETQQLVIDATAKTSESLNLTTAQKTCIGQATVSAITSVDDKKVSGTNHAVTDGLDGALAHCVSLKDFLERSFEASNPTTDPACMADYASKHLTWAQVLAGSQQTLQPVLDAATLLCVNVHAH